MQVGRPMRLRLKPAPCNQRGFTYVAVLVAMLMLALSTQAVMTYVSHQAQREREAELLRIGQAFVQAIGHYYQATPGSVKRYPKTLEDLIEDRRLVSVKRYLRRIYADPMTRKADWQIVASTDGGIAGIHSKSDATPIRIGAVDVGNGQSTTASRYSDWVFVYRPPVTPANKTKQP